MAITRRQFVTRLGTLAAALGVSQLDLAKVSEAFAHGTTYWDGAWFGKPQVFWVHGAECTGCSTSLLSLFEDARGNIQGTSLSTLNALDLAVAGSGAGTHVLYADTTTGANAWAPAPGPSSVHPFGHKTMTNTASLTGMDPDGIANKPAVPLGAPYNNPDRTPYSVNIADVLIDFIELEYHETVMGMGGDLAYQYLNDAVTTTHVDPFVMVVEGAVQKKTNVGYWNSADSVGGASWCSIGQNGAAGGTGEADFADVVGALAGQAKCAAIVAIGQCASFGGYPAAQSPVLKNDAQGRQYGASQTGAQGVYDFLKTAAADGNGILPKDKVINVPGCPTNPWWFILTVVAWMVDATAALQGATPPLGILLQAGSTKLNPAALDNTQRLKLVYGASVHGPLCPRYNDFNIGKFATNPGEDGCLQYIGCKGPGTLSLCAVHGWNGTNPQNDKTWEHNLGDIAAEENGNRASFCVNAGHPCMACTEKGYPDAFVPFVNR